MDDVTFWVDTIKNHRMVLTNGEFELELRVVAPNDNETGLPDIFRRATISDQFDVSVDLNDG